MAATRTGTRSPRRIVACLAVLAVFQVTGLVTGDPSDADAETATVDTTTPRDRSSSTSTTALGTATTLDPLTPIDDALSTAGSAPTVVSGSGGKGSTTTTSTTEGTLPPIEEVPVTTVPTGAPPGPSQPCGGTKPRSDGGVWNCKWSDEFNGAELDRGKWEVLETNSIGLRGGEACFVDRPTNVAVGGGALQLTVRKEATGFTCHKPHGDGSFGTQFTSGMVSTVGKHSWTYGRFEIRAKFANMRNKGLQTSLWLWPDNAYQYGAWPLSGEIDIAEHYSSRYDYVVPYLHYNNPNTAMATNNFCEVPNANEFHSYVLEWTPETITITYDGNLCLFSRWAPLPPQVHPQPFDRPFFLTLTQALGVGKNKQDPSTITLPATTVVDYVRIWQ